MSYINTVQDWYVKKLYHVHHLERKQSWERKKRPTASLLWSWQQGKQRTCFNELYLTLYYTSGIWIPKLAIVNIMEKHHCTKGRQNFGAGRQARSSHLSPNGQKFFLLHTMCFPDQQFYPRNKKETTLALNTPLLLLLSPTKEAPQCQ